MTSGVDVDGGSGICIDRGIRSDTGSTVGSNSASCIDIGIGIGGGVGMCTGTGVGIASGDVVGSVL